MNRSENDSAAMLRALRQHLRQRGWTARRLAEHLQIGEATAKRWLAGRGLSLARFEVLAGLCEMSLGELARETERPHANLATELTLAQERALSTDIFLAFLFLTILNGYAPDEIARDFHVPPRDMDAALLRLERLALIDRLRGGRVRPLVDRSLIWRKGPMRALFEERMKPQFMDMDFSADGAVYSSEMMKLSAQGAAMLAELIEKFRRDVQAMAERDRETTHLPRAWYGMLCAMREMDVTPIDRGG